MLFFCELTKWNFDFHFSLLYFDMSVA